VPLNTLSSAIAILPEGLDQAHYRQNLRLPSSREVAGVQELVNKKSGSDRTLIFRNAVFSEKFAVRLRLRPSKKLN
jgi:hypothetical protein